MKKIIITIVVIAAIAASAGAYYYTRPGPEPKVSTATVSRGDITESVAATGTLDAVTAVTVGSQVGGIIQELGADFNDIVEKGQVLLRINPEAINTQIEQAKATLVQRQADLDRNKVSIDDSRLKLRRTRELFAKSISTQADLDTAEVAVKSAEATQRSSEASLGQAQANLNQQEVNLRNTIILSPIRGIIIQRSVDVGQTVQANYQSPMLFIVAADLTKMKCTANIDESEVGKIRPGQNVRFRLDAYPSDSFTGTVVQVRLQPIVVQNVVTYGTVIQVPNPDYKLKPGMTANVQIEIARKTDVVRVPNSAIRFRPTAEIFEAFNQPLPPEMQQRGPGGMGGSRRGDMAGGQADSGARGESGRQGQGTQTAQAATPGRAQGAPQAAQGQNARASERGGGDRTQGGPPQFGFSGRQRGEGQRQGAGGEGQRQAMGEGMRGQGGQGSQGGRRGFDPNDPQARERALERIKQMPADQREQYLARMKERGMDLGAAAGAAPAAATAEAVVSVQGKQTIDALFGPLPPRISSGRAWLWLAGQKQLKAVRLRLGVTDGQFTELLEGDLRPGTELVTGVTLGTESANRPGAPQSGNPLMPQQRGGFGGAGGRGGGGAGH